MGSEMKALIEEWDGLGVIVRHDQQTHSWIFVALHDATLGGPVGGCRMRVYRKPEDGLVDAMRLAEGMTYKWAAIGVDYGGGKAVLAVPRHLEGDERVGLLQRFGRLLESLNGAFTTGVDLGTTPADMAVVASQTRYVHGVNADRTTTVDPGPFTALGVFHGIRAAVTRVFGSQDLAGIRVLIQGVGDVGEPLAGILSDAGASVMVSDVDDSRARKVAEGIGAKVVEPEGVYTTECDVFTPCAVGGVLNRETVGQLKCRIVAGSANNQLESEEDAGRLLDRGITYVPDYIVNAGGAIAFSMLYLGKREDEIRTRITEIEPKVKEILTESAETGESPVNAAKRRVEQVLAEAKKGKREKGKGKRETEKGGTGEV